MKRLIDTNILVSAALFPNSVPALAYVKAVTPPGKAVVCDYSLEELRRVFNEKFPNRIQDYERFVSMLVLSVEIIFTPPDQEGHPSESRIRDVKDRPILRAALAAGADILITGDKDFLESGITKPVIMTAAKFLHSS
jgi:putative PIN family toxin of toxin-antitoxin system